MDEEIQSRTYLAPYKAAHIADLLPLSVLKDVTIIEIFSQPFSCGT